MLIEGGSRITAMPRAEKAVGPHWKEHHDGKDRNADVAVVPSAITLSFQSDETPEGCAPKQDVDPGQGTQTRKKANRTARMTAGRMSRIEWKLISGRDAAAE